MGLSSRRVMLLLALSGCDPFRSDATALPVAEEAGIAVGGGDADVSVDAGQGGIDGSADADGAGGGQCLEAPFSDDFEGASPRAGWSLPGSSSRASMLLSTDAKKSGAVSMKATVKTDSDFGGGTYLGKVVTTPCVSVEFSLLVPSPTKGGIDVLRLEIDANDAPIFITARLTGSLFRITERAAAGSFYSALVDVSQAHGTWTKVSIRYDATPSLTLRLNDTVYPLTTRPSRPGNLVKGLRLGVVDADPDGEGVFFLDDVTVK